jgi:glyoxylase-like metal-dependent hydrolase (beta-lactamase superfamily II)
MIKRTPIWTTIALLLLAGSCLAEQGEQALDAYPDIYVTRLSERILQMKVRGPLGTNIVVVATEKGLVVIDTYTAPIVFEQVSKIVQKEFGRRDFAYVINSHDHVDHASGNGFFKDIIMVGHEELFKALRNRHAGRKQWQSWYRGRIQGWINGREEELAGLDKSSTKAKELAADIRLLRKVDKDFAGGFPIMPENPKEIIAFTNSHRLELGDVTIECHACKVGHSPGDILIYIPEEEFLFTGDATQLYMQKDVNMELWLGQLEHFSQPEKPVKMVLGGHDERPSTKRELKNLHDYFQATWQSVEKAHKQGLSLEKIKQQCSLDNSMSRFRSVFDVDDLAEIHAYNIELIVQRLSN